MAQQQEQLRRDAPFLNEGFREIPGGREVIFFQCLRSSLIAVLRRREIRGLASLGQGGEEQQRSTRGQGTGGTEDCGLELLEHGQGLGSVGGADRSAACLGTGEIQRFVLGKQLAGRLRQILVAHHIVQVMGGAAVEFGFTQPPHFKLPPQAAAFVVGRVRPPLLPALEHRAAH